MKLQNVTADQLRDIVRHVSLEKYDGALIFDREPETKGSRVIWVHFTLRVENGRSAGARRSHTGRRMFKACWHAHRDVMARLFDNFPDARLVTVFADYDGRADFLATFPGTGATNLGSIAQPLRADCACDCHESEPVPALPQVFEYPHYL